MDVNYLVAGRSRKPRRSAKSEHFPFADPRVPLILISDGQVLIANSNADKLRLMRMSDPKKDTMLAAWPGEYRQDVFIVDESDYYRMEQILVENSRQ